MIAYWCNTSIKNINTPPYLYFSKYGKPNFISSTRKKIHIQKDEDRLNKVKLPTNLAKY